MSPVAYFGRNLRKTVPLVLVFAFGIAAVLVTVAIVNSTRASVYSSLDMLQDVVVVLPKHSGQLESKITDNLVNDPKVRASYPMADPVTSVNLVAGGTQFNILALNEDAFQPVLDHYRARLVEGRLPTPGKAEIALSEEIMRAKGIQVNGTVGSEVDENDFLQGKYTVVGKLAGPVRVGLASLTYVRGTEVFPPMPQGLLVIPRAGEVDGLVKRINQWTTKNDTDVLTYSTVLPRIDQLLSGLRGILGILTFIVSVVLAVTVSLTNYIFFLQRIPEFGILSAIGFTRQTLLFRVMVENLLLALGSWLIGLAAAGGFVTLLKAQVFEPRGLVIEALSPEALTFSVPVPVLVGIAAIAATAWALRGLDTVSVIERRV